MRPMLRPIIPLSSLMGYLVGMMGLLLLASTLDWLGGLGLPAARNRAFDTVAARIAGFVCVSYGAFRALCFHPVLRQSYRDWLKATPWDRSKPLPVGPPHLVWEDILILGVIAAPGLVEGQTPPAVWPLLALASYLVGLVLVLFLTGMATHAYAILFLFGAAVRFDQASLMLIPIGLAVVVGRIGLWQGWERFPWNVDAFYAAVRHFFSSGRVDTIRVSCGWPYDRLRPSFPGLPRIGVIDALLIALLMGWCLDAVAIRGMAGEVAAQSFLGMTTISLTLYRLFSRLNGYGAPTGILGRIFTGRWIIPRFDQVFVAPFVILLAGGLGVPTLDRLGIPPEHAIALTEALVVFIALTMRPTLEQWRLTGGHRIVPGGDRSPTEYVKTG